MHLYIISGILLIVPIVDFALAAPVQVQEKRQACPDTDMADIPEYMITVLGKRGGEIEEAGGEILRIENWFKTPESSAAAQGSKLSEPGHVSTGAVNAPAPNPGPSTESARLLTGEPLLSSVRPAWFHPDNKLKFPEGHGSSPNTGPSNPTKELETVNTRPSGSGSSTESASLSTGKPLLSSVRPAWFHPDNKFLEAHGPPPNTGPPNTGPPNPEKEPEMVNTRPPGPGPSTDPNRE